MRLTTHAFYRIAAFVGTCALVAGCQVPGPTTPEGTFNLDFSKIHAERADGAIVFMVDGVNASVFEQMLEAGELPNIRSYFVDRGLFAPRAVCNIPSVTLANETSIATGLYPGHHGVTGINWFDRNRLIWRDYETIAQKNTLDGDYTAATIFEHFPHRTTMSVFFQPHRGATKFVENWMSAGPPFFFGWYEFVDRLTLFRFHILIDIAKQRREFPAVTVAYLLAPDFRAYASGVESPEYRQAIRHTDAQLGRVLADLDGAGLLDRLYVAIVSDHSLTEVKQHLHVGEFLKTQVGLDVADKKLWEETSFRDRMSAYRKHSCVLYGSGDRYWAICLRKPIREDGQVTGYEPWPVRPSPDDLRAYPTRDGQVDLPAVLVEQEPVDAVAYAVGRDAVRVIRKDGQVEFRQDGGPGAPIRYIVIDGTDPLGWSRKVPSGMLEGKPASPGDWLAETVDTEFPGLPAQIVAYFRSRLAGDLCVFAAMGWDFNNRNRAGHGGLRPDDMCTPMLLAGPGVPHKRIDVAQTVDLMPTLLHLLGRPVPPNVDGQVLVPRPMAR